MVLITKKNILLSGAGLSANFGGLLATEMWSKILNNPKMDGVPEIRDILKNDFDFESVYSAIKNSDSYTPDHKKIFEEIVFESYSLMDDALKEYSLGGYGKSNIYTAGVRKWLGEFAGRGGEIGAHFTLNQDLLIERETGNVPLGLLVPQNRDYTEAIKSRAFDSTQKVQLPDEAALAEYKRTYLPSTGSYCFIKLHGSVGWLSHDGHNQMVLGTNKLEDIIKEPLLKWYFDLFKEAISREGVRLFVVGYSFRDKHINDLILSAIDEHKLEICIVSTEKPEQFKNRMEGKSAPGVIYEKLNTIKIWDAVRGYFPYSLREIFPADQAVTGTFLDIQRLINKP
jgi:hypothetical protein